MTPLVGLAKAKTFAGFETEDQGVKVLVTELPADAYGEVKNALQGQSRRPDGIKPESIETAAGLAYYTVETAKDGADKVRRYSMILPGGTFSGYVAVQVPENASKIYSDDAVRQMFASAVDPQGSPGRRAARADAVQDHRARRFQECPHAGAGRRHHPRRRRRREPASRPRPSW